MLISKYLVELEEAVVHLLGVESLQRYAEETRVQPLLERHRELLKELRRSYDYESGLVADSETGRRTTNT